MGQGSKFQNPSSAIRSSKSEGRSDASPPPRSGTTGCDWVRLGEKGRGVKVEGVGERLEWVGKLRRIFRQTGGSENMETGPPPPALAGFGVAGKMPILPFTIRFRSFMRSVLAWLSSAEKLTVRFSAPGEKESIFMKSAL